MTVKFDPKKAAEIIGGEVDKVMRGVTLDLFGKIVKAPPVGNPAIWQQPESAPAGYSGGRLRANWQVSHGVPATGELSSKDASGTSTIASNKGKIDNSRSIRQCTL